MTQERQGQLAGLAAASCSLLLNLKAVFTLAIAVLLGREHLGRRGLVSALLTIVGAVVLSEGSLSGSNSLGAALIGLATLPGASTTTSASALVRAIRSRSPPPRRPEPRCPCSCWPCCWAMPSRRCR
jgi:drug/metabolite transporter (DMT)-like permease